MIVATDTDVDTFAEIVEGLEVPCDWEDPVCETPATWAVAMRCCNAPGTRCDEHLAYTARVIKGCTMMLCGHCEKYRPLKLGILAEVYSRIERL